MMNNGMYVIVFIVIMFTVSGMTHLSATIVQNDLPLKTRVSAAADRPAQCRGLAHAKYSVSRHMVIKQFFYSA